VRLFAVLASLALVACSVPCTELEPGRTYFLHVDGAITAEERADVQGALDMWREASDGALDVELSDGEGDVSLVRGPLGFSRMRREIRLPEEQTDRVAVVANIVGQMAGMQLHDQCGVLGTDGIGPVLTDADRASCRETGFCR
jgi:hypothetical protein